MRITATISNTALSGLRAYTEQAAQKVQDAIDAATVLVDARSQALVPVDTEVLRNSHTVTATGEGFGRVGTVGYHTPYALHVHEDLTANHPNGGQAKYLEQALRDSTTEILASVAKALR